MERHVYDTTAAVEDRHWWFEGRRAICRKVLAAFLPPRPLAILDAGCGGGGNLPMLRPFGQLHAFEMDDGLRAQAAARNVAPVLPGALPDAVPYEGQTFDLITLFDVLEHVGDDRAALAALHARLAPGGTLFLTVPALPLLWSRHDTAHHHFRRYRRGGLCALLERAGFQVRYASYFNTLLFPAALAVRLIQRVLPARAEADGGLKLPAPWLNRLLCALFAAERHLMPRFRLPVGVSLLIVATRP